MWMLLMFFMLFNVNSFLRINNVKKNTTAIEEHDEEYTTSIKRDSIWVRFSSRVKPGEVAYFEGMSLSKTDINLEISRLEHTKPFISNETKGAILQENYFISLKKKEEKNFYLGRNSKYFGKEGVYKVCLINKKFDENKICSYLEVTHFSVFSRLKIDRKILELMIGYTNIIDFSKDVSVVVVYMDENKINIKEKRKIKINKNGMVSINLNQGIDFYVIIENKNGDSVTFLPDFSEYKYYQEEKKEMIIDKKLLRTVVDITFDKNIYSVGDTVWYAGYIHKLTSKGLKPISSYVKKIDFFYKKNIGADQSDVLFLTKQEKTNKFGVFEGYFILSDFLANARIFTRSAYDEPFADIRYDNKVDSLKTQVRVSEFIELHAPDPEFDNELPRYFEGNEELYCKNNLMFFTMDSYFYVPSYLDNNIGFIKFNIKSSVEQNVLLEESINGKLRASWRKIKKGDNFFILNSFGKHRKSFSISISGVNMGYLTQVLERFFDEMKEIDNAELQEKFKRKYQSFSLYHNNNYYKVCPAIGHWVDENGYYSSLSR